MTRFVDGPAFGVGLAIKRAPTYLRVGFQNGEWDALDQLDDEPKPGETFYCYRVIKVQGILHINYGRGRGSCTPLAFYHYYEEQPGQEIMADNRAWRAWAYEQPRGVAEIDIDCVKHD